MMLGRKDAAATVLTVFAVMTFVATHDGWNVWLVGDSHRWAAGIIGLFGIAACALGSPARGAATRILAALGVVALVLAVVSLATGSLTPLSLLVADIVVLWVISTVRHAAREARSLPA